MTARTNHILHLVLTVVTCGLWAPVWLIIWLYNEFGPKEKVVTRYQ